MEPRAPRWGLGVPSNELLGFWITMLKIFMYKSSVISWSVESSAGRFFCRSAPRGKWPLLTMKDYSFWWNSTYWSLFLNFSLQPLTTTELPLTTSSTTQVPLTSSQTTSSTTTTTTTMPSSTALLTFFVATVASQLPPKQATKTVPER